MLRRVGFSLQLIEEPNGWSTSSIISLLCVHHYYCGQIRNHRKWNENHIQWGEVWMISSGFLILTMEKPFIVLITMNYSKYEPSLWNWLKIHTTIAYSMEYLNQKQLVVHLFAGQKIRNKTKNIERGWLVRGLKGRNVVDSEHDSVMLLFLFSVQYCHGFAGFLECDDSHVRTFRLDICAFNHR